ncbi:MAG: lamin tail domain-containing protein, partial [Opitutaceae bacterium]|nr:lamin tail domain-containing protein [Verrucomicrobiales bacterium]
MIYRRLLLAAFLWLSPIVTLSLQSQVIISEFMAGNKTTLVDDFGNSSDWIEIYNTSLSPVNLLNWGLTDEIGTPFKWRFPSTNLAAKGFMVIYASGTNRSVAGLPLHTSFSLRANGEYLALVRPDGSIATAFDPEFPSQEDDISYGTGQTVTTNVLVSRTSPARFQVPANGSLGSSWQLTGFNDSLWSNAVAAVGYQTAVAGFVVRN